KSEGSISLLLIALAVLPKVVRDRDWRAGFTMLAPGIAMWFGWSAFLKLTHSFPEHDFRSPTPANILAGIHRVPDLIRWTFEELVAGGHWALLWLFPFAAVVLMARRNPLAEWYPWAVNILTPLVLFPPTYILSGWDPVEPHLKSSLWRLWLHTAPAAL